MLSQGNFTQNMLDHVFDDNATIKVSKMPSSLVEVPRINEKYEISSFQMKHPANLKGCEIYMNN